jgi:hypothetical protein
MLRSLGSISFGSSRSHVTDSGVVRLFPTRARRIVPLARFASFEVCDPCCLALFADSLEPSPRLSQLDSCFIVHGTFRINSLHRRAVIDFHPWNGSNSRIPDPKPVPKERPDGLKLAHHYQELLDSGKFENRAALARHLGVSRARVTQVLRRLEPVAKSGPKDLNQTASPI